MTYYERVKAYLKEILVSLKTLMFWLCIGLITGALVGIVGVAFHYSIDILTEFRRENTWVLFFLPLGGLAIVYLYNFAGMENDKGTNAVILAVREDEVLPLRTFLVIFVSTVITHFLGGSAGREGAALQIGGSIAAKEGRMLKFDEKEKKILVMCGMSACFSALFGTPVTAAIFSMEVISVGIMHYSAIVPCVISSITAFQISEMLGVQPTSFNIMMVPEMDTNMIIKIIPFAVVCAFVCRLFCLVIQKVKRAFEKIIKNKYLRVVTGAAIVIIMTLISGNQMFNGAGGDIIAESFKSRAHFYIFAVKLIFTAVTLGCGFKGGEIIPSFFVGSTFGSFASEFFGINYSFGAGIGLIALFCGATNCPVTAILMSIELFGAKSFPFFALVCGISYLISGDTGLYGEQKIMYSRIRPEYINKKIKKPRK